MRLNLYWRGWDLIDIEVHPRRIAAAVLTTRPDDEPTAAHQETPVVQASGTHNFALADPYGDPATTGGFGFQAAPAVGE